MKKEDYNNIVSNFKENEFLKRRIEEGVLRRENTKKNSKRKMILIVSTILLAIIIIPVGIKTTINKNASSEDTSNSYLTTEDSIKSNNSENEEVNFSSDRPNKMSFLKIRITSINDYGFSGKVEEDANGVKSESEVIIDYDENLKFDCENLKENDVVNVGYFEIRESYPMQIKIYSIEKIG